MDVNQVVPTSLNHLVGNQHVRLQCAVALDSACIDNERFPDSVLLGPPGIGKSTLAQVIAHEMAVPFHEVLGQTLRTPSDLNNLLLKAEDKAIVHIDEIHEAPSSIQTALYMALDKRQIFVRGSLAVTALPIADFTLLCSTTEEHDLLQPLRDRMKLTLRFDYYSEEELARVVSMRATALGLSVDESIYPLIAARSRGTPRLALRLIQATHRCSRAEGRSQIAPEDFARAVELEGIDSLGLGFLEQKYLRSLVDGPRRVNVLASGLGVPTRTLTTVQEPFLIRAGLVDKDEQSRRVLTAKGREHLALNNSE